MIPLLFSLLTSTITYTATPVYAQQVIVATTTEIVPPVTEQEIKLYIINEAIAYGVDPQLALKVAKKESDYIPDKQSHYPDTSGPNGKEDSWGVFQIHLPDHPDVTRDQALDWKFNVEWAMKTMAHDGGCTQWSTCPQ